jgi:hypothetical protein
VRGEGVPHRMRVQIPVHVYQAHVFKNTASLCGVAMLLA